MPAIDRSTFYVIRLSLRGCTNRPFYHVVVMRNRQPRDGRVTDQIGTYDPLPNVHNERVVALNFDRLRNWIAAGARPSKPVLQLLGLSGYFPIHPTTRLRAMRIEKKSGEQAENAESGSVS